MTAIDWIINELRPTICLQKKYIDEIKERAKQMEKQEIIDAWHNGWDNQSPMIDEGNCGQTYYKQTFNQPNQ